MRKLLFILPLLFAGCVSECVIGQIPPQTVYIGTNCTGILPDYTGKVTVTDNCQIKSIVQTPAAGTILTAPKTTVKIRATDVFLNYTEATFTVNLIDTIPPVILYNELSVQADHDSIMRMYDIADSLLIKHQTFLNDRANWDSLGIERIDTLKINYTLITAL